MKCLQKWLAMGGSASLLFLIACTSNNSSRSHRSSENFQVKDRPLAELADHIAGLKASTNNLSSPKAQASAAATIQQLETKLRDKRDAASLARVNTEIMSEAMRGHTNIYPLAGSYHVMVIPVQFADETFVNPGFFSPDAEGKVAAQDYLFGGHADSLSTYYRHASMGKLAVSGEVLPIVTVAGNLVDYGEAIAQSSDKNARKLVTDALLKVKETHVNEDWWARFDQWDLSDYDSDRNFYEADGFVDAVILIYAGKAQSSCQRSFDPTGERPASADVPAGPRHDATVECFNRIWPHRWSISISKDDPLFSVEGPEVEGVRRPSLNGLKIHNGLFALDYNMQSEFSDRSTFTHEFGHSLSLPDIYANPGENSTGGWELMSDNASLQGQDLSSYSKLSLGWLAPKIVKQGKKSSAYLGAYAFVDNSQREDFDHFAGPLFSEELVEREIHKYDVISHTPQNGEAVYRSLAALTDPTMELVKVADFPEYVGKVAAYSGRFDGKAKTISFNVAVPDVENPKLSFDTIYFIETETNFFGNDEEIKVVTDFDIGSVIIDNQVKEELRLVSGDNNYDSLNESNPECAVDRVLELRKKRIAGTLSDEEKKEFEEKVEVCQKPVWVKKEYTLAEWRGKEIKIEIRLTTDAGYTEFGVVLDNVKVGDTLVDDFEDLNGFGEWKMLTHDGQDEAFYNQFYLFEYRSPDEQYFNASGALDSYNWDNNIKTDLGQSFFVKEGSDPIDRFRMAEMSYQPGVLVWYFNSKYGRNANSASVQDGKGYLLVLNSKIKEVPVPGFEATSFFGEDGFYLPVSADPLKTVVKQQTDEFICFSHTQYATYINGEAPVCMDADFTDAMQKLSKDGKQLRYRREWFNDILPVDQYKYYPVGQPYRVGPELRTALATFRPSAEADFAPFKIFKVQNKTLVLDESLTAGTVKFKAQDSFRDKDNVIASNPRYVGDSVVVEKKGFSFKVAEPAKRIVDQYRKDVPAEANDNIHRRPRAKVYLDWE